jgi:hypothetical protein
MLTGTAQHHRGKRQLAATVPGGKGFDCQPDLQRPRPEGASSSGPPTLSRPVAVAAMCSAHPIPRHSTGATPVKTSVLPRPPRPALLLTLSVLLDRSDGVAEV